MGLNFKGNTAMGLVTHNVKKHCLKSSRHKRFPLRDVISDYPISGFGDALCL